MVSTIPTSSLIILVFSSVLMFAQEDTPLAPALYVFGDSIFDGGNTKATFPYGVDLDPALHLPPRPTNGKNIADYIAKHFQNSYGIDLDPFLRLPPRATNGKNIADYIALWLGLPVVPPYRSQVVPNSITGINYAVAGSVLLPDKSSSYIWNFDKQIDYFKSTIDNHLGKVFGPDDFSYHLKESIFLICFGINDYGVYVNPGNGKVPEMDSSTFSKFLLQSFAERLIRLYRLGVRKFVVKNIWPLGCTPLYTSNGNVCNTSMDDLVFPFSNDMPLMLQNLASSLNGFQYSCSDDFSFYEQLSHDTGVTGITNTIKRCCDTKILSTNRDAYLFFDTIHQKQAANQVYALNCFNGTMCSPQNIFELAGLRLD